MLSAAALLCSRNGRAGARAFILNAIHARDASTMTESEFYKEIRAASGAFKFHCDGKWLESSSGKTVGVVNPCTRQKEYEVQACTKAEVDAAFAAAKAAQKQWAKTPLWQRAAALRKAAALLREHAQPVADCLVKEVAKPAKDSLTEVVR